MKLHVELEQWPLRIPFRIAGQTIVRLEVIVVTLVQNGSTGRGEAAGVD